VPLGRFGDGEAFSLHHTKPCGVGEGGCVVVPAEHENSVRSLINFGRYDGLDTGHFSTNGKLSDIAAAYILDRLRSAEKIRATYRQQWRRVVRSAGRHGFEVLGDSQPGLPAVVALIAPGPCGTETLDVPEVKLQRLYPPLAPEMPRAAAIHERLVCVPCHSEMATLSDECLDGVFARLRDRAGPRGPRDRAPA